MELSCVTTPFGRRPMTLGMIASQMMSRNVKPNQSIDKWKLYRALCEAKPSLGITDRALAVLSALLSFYPKNELSEGHGLIVFPSNRQLSLRAHGMAEQTIRRHLAALIEAGLLIRKDSPNGKRYARRGRAGEVSEAFGFSLAPLLARAEEIEHLAAEIVADRLYVRSLRERITLCRRDVAKLIAIARDQEPSIDWERAHDLFRTLIESLPRNPNSAQLSTFLDKLELLRGEIINRLEMRMESQKQSAIRDQNERHIQNSHPDSSFDSEPHPQADTQNFHQQQAQCSIAQTDNESDRPDNPTRSSILEECADNREARKTFPLQFILQACPEIRPYAPGGTVGSWRDLMSAAIVVRTMLGVSPSAYAEACGTMGPENAAIVMACILQRAERINSAGGYLRDLTRRSERGKFAIEPMLMALARDGASKRQQPDNHEASSETA